MHKHKHIQTNKKKEAKQHQWLIQHQQPTHARNLMKRALQLPKALSNIKVLVCGTRTQVNIFMKQSSVI